MAELILDRRNDTITVRLGALTAEVALASLPGAEQLAADCRAYGRALFDALLPAPGLHNAVEGLGRNDRLALVTGDDPLLASIPWEYLRTSSSDLLAARVPFVRALPEAQRRPAVGLGGTVEVLAVPVSPIDDARPLNTEAEWQRLRSVALRSERAFRLTRVRPPELGRLSRSLGGAQTSIFWFMGHSTAVAAGQALPEGQLAFEDSRGKTALVGARKLADALDDSVLLVVLNSCLSATSFTHTEFANIARSLVTTGVPYALGMQFVVPDDGAVALSEALLEHLLRGRSIEDAVRRTRAELQDTEGAWMAGIPVLYTSQREALPGLSLSEGAPRITPSEQQLAQLDISALPPARHFVGRQVELAQVLDELLQPKPKDFIVLHGIGGTGKTALARAVAERIGWHFDDRVFAHSFELFASFDDADVPRVNVNFEADFLDRLARFFGLDPAELERQKIDLKLAILQAQRQQRRLLILDNIETLVDAQEKKTAEVQQLAGFVSRLREGPGAILVTTRSEPAMDWGSRVVIEVPGLLSEAGAQLFRSELDAARRDLAKLQDARTLSMRVQGHPLSIRLLAGRFNAQSGDLARYLIEIEDELLTAEKNTPDSLADPERQKTLYACLRYSEKRLTEAQRLALRACAVFRAPFTAEMAGGVFEDAEHAEVRVRELAKLGWLEGSELGTPEGVLVRYEPHAMTRWYARRFVQADEALLSRYGRVVAALAKAGQLGISQSVLMNRLVRGSLADFEAAVLHLDPRERAVLQFHHAEALRDLGQPERALALYRESLETTQQLGDVRGVAVTKSSLAGVYVQQGWIEKALALYGESLQSFRQLADTGEIGMTMFHLANLLLQLGQITEALALYEDALKSAVQLGNTRGIASIQNSIAGAYLQLGRIDEALVLYREAIEVTRQLEDARGLAAAQFALANVYMQLGRIAEALAMYQDSLAVAQQMGYAREAAVTQGQIAYVYALRGKTVEALTLYDESLDTFQRLGDIYNMSVTQNAMADVLLQCGQVDNAMGLLQTSLKMAQQLNDARGIAATQRRIADIYVRQSRLEDALATYLEVMESVRSLRDPRGEAVTMNGIADVYVQQGQVDQAVALYSASLDTMHRLGDVMQVAIMQLKMAHAQLRANRNVEAIRLLWNAYRTMQQLEVTHLQIVSKSIFYVRATIGREAFDRAWAAGVQEPQPEWLQSDTASGNGDIGAE